MTFGEKLKKARQKANLSQKEMAEKLEINIRTYGSYERDERDVSTALLLKICNTLHISSDDLLQTDALEGDYQKHSDMTSDKDKIIKPAMTSRQQHIVDLFNDLTTEQQDNIIGRAELLAEQNEDEYRKEDIG